MLSLVQVASFLEMEKMSTGCGLIEMIGRLRVVLKGRCGSV
jgi:hypothetical protein